MLTARCGSPPGRKPIPSGGENDQRFPQGRPDTSAHTHRRGKAASGRIEMRAYLPTGPGDSKDLWPALWMRPVDDDTGEIDSMAGLGGDGSDDEWRQAHLGIPYDYACTHPNESGVYTVADGEAPWDGFH